MPRRPTLTLLQPIDTDTPLAALLNRWLAALAPAEALTRTGRKSAARDYLQLVTHSLHRYHQMLTQVKQSLHLGRPVGELGHLCTNNPGKPSLCVPVPQPLAALAVAALGEGLTTSTALRAILGYSNSHQRAIIVTSPDFAETAATIERILAASKQVGLGLLGRNALTPDQLAAGVDELLNAAPSDAVAHALVFPAVVC